MATILATGPVHEAVPPILAPYGEVVVAPDDAESTLRGLVGEAVGLIARGPSWISAGLIEAAPRLRVIGRSGVGVDGVDLAAATRRGIPVVVTPGAGATAVAEGAIALLLAVRKRLRELDTAVRAGDWLARDRVPVDELDGTALGLVGLGAIGRRVAALAAAFGMTVCAYDPYVRADEARRVGVEPMDAADMVARVDHLSLHAPLTDATRGLVNDALLARARPGLVLVNTARGGLAPLDVLDRALADGRLGGVGLDVFDPEPPDPAHPIFARPDVLATPHVLGLTTAARQRIFVAMAEGMAAVLSGDRAPHVANPQVYAREVGGREHGGAA